MRKMDIIHPMRRFRCFVFDLQLKLRSSRPSKPKRKIRLFIMYVSCPPLCPMGFQHSKYCTKLKNYCVRNKFFNKKIQKRMNFHERNLIKNMYGMKNQAKKRN